MVEKIFLTYKKKAAANTSVPLTANINIEALVDLKLHLRRHTVLFYLLKYVWCIWSFNFCVENWKKKIFVSWFFFSNLTVIYFLLVLHLQTNSMTVCRWRMGLWVPVFETVLKLPTNSMTVYQQCIFRTSTPVFLEKRHLHVLLLKIKLRPNQY